MTAAGNHGRPARSAIDRALYALLTRRWGTTSAADYLSSVARYNALLTHDERHTLALIDAKATGLLTHVSLMIAGLGLVAPLVASSEIEISVVIFEIAVYLLIAVGCLRCLSIFRWREFSLQDEHLRAVISHELVIRRELYSLCQRAAIIFTLIVFLLLPVLYFAKPGKILP